MWSNDRAIAAARSSWPTDCTDLLDGLFTLPINSSNRACQEGSMTSYPRDMIGYGGQPPHAQWPGDARIALQFVINYEEGGENAIFHGDPAAESFLTEWIGAQPALGMRNMNIESLFEYGSRAGFWRLHRAFTARNVPVTVYGVAMALERNPACGRSDARSRLGNRNAWLPLDRLPIRAGIGRARAHCQSDRDPYPCDRHPPSGLVSGALQPEHPPPRRRGGRLCLQRRQLRRRSAVLGHFLRQTAADRPLRLRLRTICALPQRKASTRATSSSPI